MNYNLRFMKSLSSYSFAAILIIVIVFSTTGCIASLPVAVNLIDQGRQYTATLDVSKEPGEIYHIVVRELEKIPDVTIIRKDNASFSVEASARKRSLASQPHPWVPVKAG